MAHKIRQSIAVEVFATRVAGGKAVFIAGSPDRPDIADRLPDLRALRPRKGWTAVKLMQKASPELQAHGTNYSEVETLPDVLLISGSANWFRRGIR